MSSRSKRITVKNRATGKETFVRLNGVITETELTPEIARRAAHVAHGLGRPVIVTDSWKTYRVSAGDKTRLIEEV